MLGQRLSRLSIGLSGVMVGLAWAMLIVRFAPTKYTGQIIAAVLAVVSATDVVLFGIIHRMMKADFAKWQIGITNVEGDRK